MRPPFCFAFGLDYFFLAAFLATFLAAFFVAILPILPYRWFASMSAIKLQLMNV
jgi:hypothetical protein